MSSLTKVTISVRGKPTVIAVIVKLNVGPKCLHLITVHPQIKIPKN